MLNYLYLIGSVVVGSLAAGFIRNPKTTPVKMLLTFSGAYLLSIGVFHLIPEVYSGGGTEIGLFIMGGFFLQLILEFFSKGVEHGHSHLEMFRNKGIPVSIIVSLYLHALLESLPVGTHQNHGDHTLLWAIVIHKVPVSLVLYFMVAEVFGKRWKIILFMLGFALVAPIGVLLGDKLSLLAQYHREITALVLGIFLHISTTILFESSQSHRFNFSKLATTLVAVILAWLSL